MILFSTLNIRSRALIEVSGTILKSEEGHVPLHPHRLLTTYTIQPFDGGKTIRYTAAGNDPSLARHLPVDTVVEKKEWQLSYFINGEKVSDFPIRFYAGIGFVGILLLLIGLITSMRKLLTYNILQNNK